MAAVSFIICAAASLWPLLAFFALRKSLSPAQEFDVKITEGWFISLPIYKYMRAYVYIALIAISLIFLISAGAAIMVGYSLAIIKDLPFLKATSSLLALFLAVHVALLAMYESTKPEDRTSNEKGIRQILLRFRKKLWVCAFSLFFSAVLLMLWGLGYTISQAT